MKEHKLPKYVWGELTSHNIKEGDVLCTSPVDLSFDCEYISGFVFLTDKLIGVYTERLPDDHVWYFRGTKTQDLKDVQQGSDTDIRLYDIEKTVVDIVFYRERVGIEETKEILHNYLRSQDRQLDRLYAYAKTLHCEKIIRTYLEVLI